MYKDLQTRKCLLGVSMVFALLGVGCFDIIEEVELHEDGSGYARLTVDMSRSRGKIRALLFLDKVNGFDVPSQADLEAELARLDRAIKAIPGISEVNAEADYEHFVLVVGGKFAHIHALNLAINEVGITMNRTPYASVRVQNFAYRDSVFDRYHRYIVDQEAYKEIRPINRAVVNGVRYTCIYRFPRTVRHFSHPQAKRSASGRAIRLDTKLKALIKGQSTLENRIVLE